MSKHTPEPWEVWDTGKSVTLKAKFGTPGMDASQLYPVFTVGPGVNQNANARRIVECVNACEGINPDAVPELLAALQSSIQNIEQLASTVNVLSPGKVRADDFSEKAREAIKKAIGT